MFLALLLIINSASASQIVTIQSKQFEFSDHFSSAQIASLTTDLETLSKLEIKQDPLYQAIFGKEYRNYFEWFAAHIHRFGLWTTSDKKIQIKKKDCGSYHITSAYADKDYDKEGVLFKKGDYMVTQYYFNEPASERLSTLIHEAKHADGSGHVMCRKAFNAKLDRCLVRAKGACDKDEFGSYTADALIQIQATRLLKDIWLNEAAGRALSATSRIRTPEGRKRVGKEIQKLLPELKIQDSDLDAVLDTADAKPVSASLNTARSDFFDF